MTLINEDYEEFVSLSSKIAGADRSIARLKGPLLEMKKRIGEVREEVSVRLDTAGLICLSA